MPVAASVARQRLRNPPAPRAIGCASESAIARINGRRIAGGQAAVVSATSTLVAMIARHHRRGGVSSR